MEGIGIAIDDKGDRMFFTDLAAPSVYLGPLDGSEKRTLLDSPGAASQASHAQEIPQREN